MVVHVAKNGAGHRRVLEIVALSGRTERDVVEVSSVFAWQGQGLARAQGWPPHAERFAWAGYDLADLEKAEVTVLQAYMPEQMTDAQIDAEITNICRCGTFQQVREAIHAAAKA